MRETLVMLAALQQAPISEPALMVLFGTALLTLATWLRRSVRQ